MTTHRHTGFRASKRRRKGQDRVLHTVCTTLTGLVVIPCIGCAAAGPGAPGLNAGIKRAEPVLSVPIREEKFPGHVVVDTNPQTRFLEYKSGLLGKAGLDCASALSESVLCFAGAYFENASLRTQTDQRDYQYALTVSCKQLRTTFGSNWANYYFPIRLTLLSGEGRVLADADVEGHAVFGRLHGGHSRPGLAWSAAIKDALQQGFDRLIAAPEVAAYAYSIEPERHAASKGKPSTPASTVDDQPVSFRRPKPAGQHWAVVIGISDYLDHRIPRLRYASNDAEAFHAWLTLAEGGRYAPANTRLLVDKVATAENIRDALFDWLAQALEEDLVTIYFSGHGTPESPDRPENLFLVPYDADYDRIAATAFPMWDIETALKRFIKARKVVVIADACHAGGVGSEFAGIRRAIGIQQAGLVSDGLQDLAQANDGVAVLTSAGSKQLSQEGEKWGGGHGVFTYYLLQGLKGQADYNSDSRVTLGELTLYVSEQVRRATKNAQSPEVAGKFDPALTIGR